MVGGLIFLEAPYRILKGGSRKVLALVGDGPRV
jgi:hypothetical protein